MRARLYLISVQIYSQTPSSPVAGDLTTAGHTWDLREKGRVSETHLSPKRHQTGAHPTYSLLGIVRSHRGVLSWTQFSCISHSIHYKPAAGWNFHHSNLEQALFLSKAFCGSPLPTANSMFLPRSVALRTWPRVLCLAETSEGQL